MTIKHELKRLLWKVGYDISSFSPLSHPLARRKQILAGMDTVLDVGANVGQFARQLRFDLGFTRRIVSFEPLRTAFATLQASAKDDPAWEVLNCALGDREQTLQINVAGNSHSSSLLGMLPAHIESEPGSRYIGTETVETKTLDGLFGRLCPGATNIYMKIDTQGFEAKVLKGAENSLPRIGTVQMEMSLVPLYDGELLFPEMCALMSCKGYSLVAIEGGFTDRTSGRLLQVDGIFQRL